jgi:quercetin dioxygenase-like cupin family protein
MLIADAGVTPEKFRNEKVVVVEERLRPGETQSVRGELASVAVYFEGGSLEILPEAGKPRKQTVRRGDTVFQPPEARTVKNIGSSEVHFVRIDFLGRGVQETWGATGLSPNYKLLFENQYARAYEIRILAGTSEPQHSHKDRVVVCLSGAELVHRMPDGREEPSTLRTGETVWRRGGTHVGQNVGKTELWAIAVEPK